MDKIDKKIITLLQQNARMPLKALAENVFLSSPAVSARIERLEKEEIIEGYEVKINQLKLGYHITAFINLEVAPVQKPEFYPFIKTCPNVVECNCDGCARGCCELFVGDLILPQRIRVSG